MVPKILIIDDEVELVALTAKVLKSAPYEVFCHYQGRGALEAVRQFNPSVVLLDIRLPDISGLEVFSALKADMELKGIPVIFFSATAQAENLKLERLKPAGIINKPYEVGSLLSLVDDVLLKKQLSIFL